MDIPKHTASLVIRISYCSGVFLVHLLQDATDSRVFIQVLVDGFVGGVANLLVRKTYDWIDLQRILNTESHNRGYNISVLNKKIKVK